jgi:predicted ATPase
MSSHTESFGALLRGHRVAAGLTQEALAARAGLSSRGIAEGKTRLALRTAARAKSEYPNGVCVAELAALTQADLIGHTVGFSLGISQEQHRSVSVSLVDALRSKRMLLVLDNCEHLVQACAELVHTLLRRGCASLPPAGSRSGSRVRRSGPCHP